MSGYRVMGSLYFRYLENKNQGTLPMCSCTRQLMDLARGIKASKEELVELLNNEAKITTITWNYHPIHWPCGAQAEYVQTDGQTCFTPIRCQ